MREPLRLLYFGFIYRGKGIEDLLDAFATLLAQRPEWRGRIRLTLAGGSTPEITFAAQSDYLGELRERASRRGRVDVGGRGAAAIDDARCCAAAVNEVPTATRAGATVHTATRDDSAAHTLRPALGIRISAALSAAQSIRL